MGGGGVSDSGGGALSSVAASVEDGVNCCSATAVAEEHKSLSNCILRYTYLLGGLLRTLHTHPSSAPRVA